MSFRQFTVVGLCVLSLTACGGTIVTRIHSRDILDRSRTTQSVRQAWRMEKRSGVAPRTHSLEEAAKTLRQWAGDDSDRLTLAAQAVLDMRPRGSTNVKGFALAALQLAYRSLQASGIPSSQWLSVEITRQTVAVYNAALGRFVSLSAEELARGFSDQDFWTPFGRVVVSTKYMAHPPYRAGYFDTFIPAAHVGVRGISQRIISEGLGVALVGARERTAGREEEMYYQPPDRGVYAPFAAVAKFQSRPNASRASIDLLDLSCRSEIAIDDGKIPLRGDFTAPFALSFRGINDLLMGISGVMNIEKRKKDAGLYLTEPFDPDRIPVVLIHGLTSSPLVWRSIATKLMADPMIRRYYQFWYVYYPTGMPITESAASIHEDISTIRNTFDPRGSQSPPGTSFLWATAWEGSLLEFSRRTLALDSGTRSRRFPSIELPSIPKTEQHFASCSFGIRSPELTERSLSRLRIVARGWLIRHSEVSGSALSACHKTFFGFKPGC